MVVREAYGEFRVRRRDSGGGVLMVKQGDDHGSYGACGMTSNLPVTSAATVASTRLSFAET
jgi:hypothetical protein